MKPEEETIQIEMLKVQQKQLELQQKNSEILMQVVSQGMPLLKEYCDSKMKHIEGPKIRWSIIGFLGILFLIVLVTGFLVYVGRLDGSNFTFLLGTLIGGAITFLGDMLLPSE